VKRCCGGWTIRNGFGRPYRLDGFAFTLVYALTINVRGLLADGICLRTLFLFQLGFLYLYDIFNDTLFVFEKDLSACRLVFLAGR